MSRLHATAGARHYRRAEEVDFYTDPWPAAERATLLFVVNDARILLIRKRRGHGAGKISGPGGKLEGAETPRACAVRETREELRIEPLEVSFAGELRFQDVRGPRMQGYVFRAECYRGVPVQTPEAIPCWCAVDAIPYEEMWADDRLWLPRVLERVPFAADVFVDDDQVLAQRLRPGPFVAPDPG